MFIYILGLVHKSGNGIYWFSALKIVYMHLPSTVDRDGAQLSAQETRVPKKKVCQIVNMEKK